MTDIVGVDGCTGGWLFVAERAGQLDAGVAPDLRSLLSGLPDNAIVAIDIPIGLTDSGPRSCDLEARRLLGVPRGSSVSPAPVRPCLGATTYSEACAAHFDADGRRISQQAFGILQKICQVDELLSRDPRLQDRVREVHPEVCFALWNNGRPMLHRKSRRAGRLEREALIDAVWPGERQRLRGVLRGRPYKADDLNDAFAALWTARRIRKHDAEALPIVPPTDSRGLRMEMVA